ncbi:ammonium transporter 2 [Quercus suber]|uniref:Ammonium transporter 2 n=1 Tax=Quercus suber TaxID=58331 RepID=A0AAW0KPR4_QUESU
MSYSSYNDYNLPEALFPDEASPPWNNKGDNEWQLTSTTLVGPKTVPGLDCGEKEMGYELCFHGPFRLRRRPYLLGPMGPLYVLWCQAVLDNGQAQLALTPKFLLGQSINGKFPMADFVCFQFAFAAITVVLLAGSLLGRMNFYAWMFFVPLWLTFCYTIGAFTIWGHGFLQPYIIDYAGGFIVHLSSGVAGWTGFNGGSPYAANEIAALAIVNTHLCAATRLVSPWAAVFMGTLSGLLPWYTMMVLHRKSAFFHSVDDTLGVFHTHAVARTSGGFLSGFFAKPALLRLMYGSDNYGPCLFYNLESGELKDGLRQIGYQLAGVVFVTVEYCYDKHYLHFHKSMDEDALDIGDDAAHGEEAYALWGENAYSTSFAHIS